MKNIVFVLVFLIVCMFLYFLTYDDPYISNAEKQAKFILGKTAKIIEKKYGLHPSGLGLAMPGGNLKEFIICFNTEKELKKEELRILLFKCASELLDQINANQEIRPAMVVYPFTEENIDVIIYNYGEGRTKVYDPNIAVAELSGNTLIYNTLDETNRYIYKNTYSETYQEALRATQK